MENTQNINNENKGLNRIAKLLEDYRKETSNTYDKVQRFRLYGKITSVFFYSSQIILILSLIVFFGSFMARQGGIILTIIAYSIFSLPTMIIIKYIHEYMVAEIGRLETNLIISRDKLTDIIQFATKALGLQELTENEIFEFQTLVKDAEIVCQKAREEIKSMESKKLAY